MNMAERISSGRVATDLGGLVTEILVDRDNNNQFYGRTRRPELTFPIQMS